MKLGKLVTTFLAAALPLGAGVLFTGMIDPTKPFTTPQFAGTYGAGLTISITATGTVNLNSPNPNNKIVTNPDGSIVPDATLIPPAIPPASCNICWIPGYQYFTPLNNTYPTIAGGDGINHFVGGGANYDTLPSGSASPWADEGARTTNTLDPAALRFGSLAGTFVANPTATDWFLVGYGGVFNTGVGGTLRLVVVDTFYPNNTGGFAVTISDQAGTVPEPSAVWLAFSGFAVLGLPKAYRLFSRKG
jgi:hypothetical protein